MGTSSSREQGGASLSLEQREAESAAASTGALPVLQQAFSALSDPDTKTIPLNSLQKCFDLNLENPIREGNIISNELSMVLKHLSSSIIDLFFLPDKGGISWIEFLRGYTKCCGRQSSSTSFNKLFKLFAMMIQKAGCLTKLEFESEDDVCKINGSLTPADVLMILSICWVMCLDSNSSRTETDFFIPDLNNLVLSAAISSGEVGDEMDLWNCDVSCLDIQLPAGKVQIWVLKTVPYLVDCFTQFVHSRLSKSAIHEEKLVPSCSSDQNISSKMASNPHLLNCGSAWAISLTMKSTISEEILKACFINGVDETNDNLLYRSSFHGKGINRFWSNVQGYNGPILILIAATNENNNGKRWIIGSLTHQGVENKDAFYGTSGSLYALSPVFHVFPPTGREKNFVYSHLHATGRVYEPHPKKVGIAFGGSTGNERIFMDGDFAKLTVRHHSVDKTYQTGALLPNQGFLPVEASVLEVEVWGLGGNKARQVQASYKKREDLFKEQRRKVDLKTFGSWEDSPEKMMMDMVSDPNTVQREDR